MATLNRGMWDRGRSRLIDYAARALSGYDTVVSRLREAAREHESEETRQYLALFEQDNEDLRTQIAEHKRHTAEMVAERAYLVEELEALQGENVDLRHRWDDARRKLALVEPLLWRDHADAMAAFAESPTPDGVESAGDAALFAQAYLSDHLVLPDSACVDLEAIDTAVESKAWGQTSLRGFLALHAYGRALSAGEPGSFWTWCVNSGHPYAWTATSKKLAMAESATVKNTDKLRAKRIFEVDPSVDPSGHLFMEAHLKIAEGGGNLAPRVYFHPSREQGRVHVGYFGPHRNVPNTVA
ncbi:hypothetical protein GCM10022243_57510 [Saccharothrix violaceirubra]|uniref:Uncharacterized protein n=1 Tax=Saccharothrix violaceirubra TaxID=413306 RepID=A0A7W7T4D4_9PSEU|nr:hypothetical protein [Saccharothrix violaceirubra]MBB4965817.1 hypothetical protein [Saccharothrix violaceirubra]